MFPGGVQEVGQPSKMQETHLQPYGTFRVSTQSRSRIGGYHLVTQKVRGLHRKVILAHLLKCSD